MKQNCYHAFNNFLSYHCSQSKKTPLHLAAIHGHNSIMQILLAHGADPGLLDENGNTAQQIVTKYGHFEAAGIVPGSQVQSQRNPKSNITNKQAADPRAGGLINPNPNPNLTLKPNHANSL